MTSTTTVSLSSLFSLKQNLRSLFIVPKERVAIIDGLRAIAILWLILFHSVWMSGFFYDVETFQQLNQYKALSWIIQGHLGVDIFFVISGFLIGSILLKEMNTTGNIRFKHFYKRRALRILPAYFFTLALLASITSKNVDTLWANLLFVNNFLPVEKQFMLWSWSLAIEEQFYLLCPFLLLFLYRRRYSMVGSLLILLLASFLIRYVVIIDHSISLPLVLHSVVDEARYYHVFDALYDKTYTRFGGLVIGVLAAVLYDQKHLLNWLETHTQWRRFLWWLACFIMLFLTLPPWVWVNHINESFFTFLLTSYRNLFSLAIAYWILYTLTTSGKVSWINRCLSSKYWYPIAQLSYSAFLIHLMVIFVLGQSIYARIPLADYPYAVIPVASLFILVTFSVALLMYLFISTVRSSHHL